MTTEFRYMMHLAGCAALGKSAEMPPEGLDWEKVLTFANEQTVLPLVQYAMKKAAFPIPEEIRKPAVTQLNRLAMQALIRRRGVLQVLSELEKQGIRAAVIKGFAIARDYAQPDVRISGDADIYIAEKDEAQALEVFSRFGFRYTPREKHEKDTALTHPRYGLVELHVRLFDDFIEEYWYDGEESRFCEDYVRQETADGSFYRLGDTDHFLFVLEHAIKHFITGGMTARMMLDIGVLWQRHRETLNQERIAALLKKRRYEKAFRVFLKILSEDCGFEACGEALGTDRKSCDLLLQDMEEAGAYGRKLDDQKTVVDALRIYNAELQKEKRPSVKGWFMLNREWISVLFPPVKEMREKYPCVGKCVACYPFAWLHRLLTKGLRYIFRSREMIKKMKLTADENELSSSIGSKRAELFRLLEMM